MNRTTSTQVVVLIAWLATVIGAAVMAVTAIVSYGIVPMAFLAMDAVAFASIGALIVRRQPANRVGWLLVMAGPALVLTFSGFVFGAIRFGTAGAVDPLAMVLSWLGANALYPTFMLIALIGLLFPDGSLPSPRWKPLVRTALVVAVASAITVAIRPGPIADELADNPFGVDHPAVTALTEITFPIATIAFLLTVVLAACSVAIRFRRAQGETRQQLKWFVTALAIFATLLPLSFIDTAFIAEINGFTPIDLLAFSSLALIPLSVGVAVLRYRLYAIDRIISRTLSWGLVTVLLFGTFGLLVVGLQGILAEVTSTNALAVTASTLVVALLFQPLRRRVQTVVDRRFDRARYDADRVIEGFSGRLRDQLDLDALRDEVRQVAEETVRPRDAAVWLRTAERGQRLA